MPSPKPAPHDPAANLPVVPPRWQIAAWLAAVAVVLYWEILRWNSLPPALQNPIGWLFRMNVDTTPAAFFLLAAPLFWSLRFGLAGQRGDILQNLTRTLAQYAQPRDGNAPRPSPITWILAFVCFSISLACSAHVGHRFDHLPPAYHDEYSYLFQAKSYLQGHLSYPVHEAGPIFDQMHVLNHGRFASRYFPGTGAWLAPFVAIGLPYLAQYLAGALTTFFIFWLGWELGGTTLATSAALLVAFCPGFALFSNLLLAHHPTLVGLSLFLLGYVRTLRSHGNLDLLLAGLGLAFAMLCRPMTAAGFALPFGLHFLWSLFRSFQTSKILPFKPFLAMGTPLLCGGLIMLYCNQQITGHHLRSPYQEYTDFYTPRHVFGFNNVLRGEQKLAGRTLPIVTRKYDTWAENLTPRLAAWNVYIRTIVSAQWTLGVIPLLMVAVMILSFRGPQSPLWFLILASILSLHVVHIPYWFDGIMHWHYVFESALCWLLLTAACSCALLRNWSAHRRPWMPLWWASFLAATTIISYFPLNQFWESRVDQGISEIRFARQKYADFQTALNQQVTTRPALVLIEHDPDDRSLDYVNNPPDLNSDLLLGRFDPETTDIPTLQKLFPHRTLYLHQIKPNTWSKLSP